MIGPDSTAIAALGAEVLKPAFVCYMDIVGDPVRATTFPVGLNFSGTGDADLDGHLYSAVDPTMVGISPVKFSEGGSETVTASLSGIVGPDTDLLNLIGDQANWRGRLARLWMGIYNEANAQQGAFWAYYTGRMVAATIKGEPANQTIDISIESYLATLTAASNRTYLDQETFDPDDHSAEAAIAIANGLSGNGLTGGLAPTITPDVGGLYGKLARRAGQ